MVSSRRCYSTIPQKIYIVRSLLYSCITECIFCHHNNVFRRVSALQRLGTHHGDFQGHSSCLKRALDQPEPQVTTRHQKCARIFNSASVYSVLHLYNKLLTYDKTLACL